MSDPSKSQSQRAVEPKRSSRRPLRYAYWFLACLAVVFAVVAVGAAFPALLKPLSSEGGVLELLSLACWASAMLFALLAVVPRPNSADRLIAGWTGLVALLAFLRELDLHVALNPDVLGPFGVRYRIDWWLDSDVSLWLKLGWGVTFLALLCALVYPPWALRVRIIRLVRRGDTMVSAFLLAIALSMLGFVFDDLLRGTKLVPLEIRQTAEEACEMLGAAAFLASAILRCPRRIYESLRSRTLKAFIRVKAAVPE